MVGRFTDSPPTRVSKSTSSASRRRARPRAPLRPRHFDRRAFRDASPALAPWWTTTRRRVGRGHVARHRGGRGALEALRVELKRRDDAYELKHGVKSRRSSPRTPGACYLRLKAGELALAERRRKPGGCAFSRVAADTAPREPPTGATASAACTPLGRTLRPEARVERPGRRRRPRPPPRGESNPDGRGGARTQQTTSRKTNIHRRMKKTNPLAARTGAAPAPDWSSVFADPALLTLCDVGCAGAFPAARRRRGHGPLRGSTADRNLLGLGYRSWRRRTRGATRTPRAAARRATSGGMGEARPIDNLHFIACNANVSLDQPACRTWAVSCSSRSVEPEETHPGGSSRPSSWTRSRDCCRRGVPHCCSDVRPLAAEMQAFSSRTKRSNCRERRCGSGSSLARA